jgi:magnesium-transporting ATPase (P-type)
MGRPWEVSMDRAELLAAAPAGAYRILGSSPRGLSTVEAARRLAESGPNTLPPPAKASLLRRFAVQFTDLFAVMLLAAASISFLAYVVPTPRDVGNAQLALAILGVVVLNAAIGFVQEYSAERTVQALQAMVPHTCRVLRDGERQDAPAGDLVPGDVIALEAGDAVPADCRLVEAYGFALDNSALSGESEPLRRTAGPEPLGVAALEARNCAFMGTTVAAGTAKAVVYATGPATEFGRIFRLTTETARQPTPLQRQVAVMTRRVSAAAVAIGVAVFAIRGGTGSPVVASFVFALGVMVALVPEGLPATLSVSLAVGVRRMARQHALVKRLLAVEALGSTTVICTDKTGTLTQDEMTVQRCWAGGRPSARSRTPRPCPPCCGRPRCAATPGSSRRSTASRGGCWVTRPRAHCWSPRRRPASTSTPRSGPPLGWPRCRSTPTAS